MCRKLIYLVSFVLVLGSVSNAAEIFWSDGDPTHNHLWTDPDNWLGGVVPVSGDEVQVLSPEADAGHGPIIREGMNITLLGLKNELEGRPGKPELTMTGGRLELTDFVWWGDYDNIEAFWYQSGGNVIVANEFELGWGPGTGGAGTLDMTGGTIIAGTLVVPTGSGAYGNCFLRGGTFTVRESGGLRMNANGLIDFGEGVLVLEGDETVTVNNLIAAGQITAYGGIGTVLVTFNGQKTTVAAIGSPRASEPNPADEATDVQREVVLGWKPGFFASPTNGHKVYFSENFNNVNDGIGGVTQDSNSYTPPQRLDLGTTYYWRVDEVNNVNPDSPWIGNVWSFTAEPVAYPVENITATASSTGPEGMDPENTINGSGLDANDLHSTQEMAMWLSGEEKEPNRAWIEYEFDKVYKLHEMWVWNSNQAIESILGLGFKDVTIEHSTNGTDWTTLGTTHEFNRAPGADGYASNTTVDFGGAAAKYVRLTANSNWESVMDQFSLSEVRFLYIPIRGREPQPESGATDVEVDLVLSFRAGREAAEHDVYLSADEQTVIDGTAPVTTVTEASDGPLSLDLATTYYWKVNEVNMAETPTTLDGDVWNFTTREYFVVDDFEDYNDYPPNEIWATWVDGYGVPENGSQVGYPNPDWNQGEHFVETSIVHGGEQAMPLFYSNTGTATYSEGKRTFAVPQDWTAAGVQTLAVHFHGAEGNTGQLYVKVNGSKVVYDGDAGDIQQVQWKQWNIDLALLGVDLQSVTTLVIGIDDNGASGTLYFDDIRLYRPRPIIFLSDDFEGYADDAGLTAAGWAMLDTPTATENSTWTITNPGGRANPPTLDGSASTGNFMISDSDTQSESGDQDNGASHDLYTPSFSTLGGSTVWLHVDVSAQLNDNGTAIFDVEVSTDGETWTNVFSRVAPGRGTSEPATTRLPDNTNADGYFGRLDLDLSAVAADSAAVQVRFRQYEPDWDWWIAIDNVLVDDVAAPQGGPITVFSEDFSNGLGQMEVFSGQGNTGTETWHTTDKGGRYVPGTVQNRGVNRLGPHPGATPDFAIIDSDANPDPAEDEWLMTPTLDLSGMTEVFLHYESETVMSSGVWNQEVLVSLDGGSTFETTPIFAYTGGGLFDNGEEPAFAERIFDVSGIAAGESQVVFAFRYTGDGDDWWWAIDNVEVSGSGITLSGLADVTVVDGAIVSVRHAETEYVVADGDLILGTTTRWYIDPGTGAETLWVEGAPAPADTVSGTSNAKSGDVGSKADNFLFTLDGSSNISSIDGIDFQETIFPSLTDTFFLFERGGNDVGSWQAILEDGSLGAEVAFDKASNGGPYADTGVSATGGQNGYGVVFTTDVPVQGVRITASGHDTLSISTPVEVIE